MLEYIALGLFEYKSPPTHTHTHATRNLTGMVFVAVYELPHRRMVLFHSPYLT